MEHLETSLAEIAEASVVPDVSCEVIETARHWPMEKLERSGRLVEHARDIADSMGFQLKDTGTGGASDANTTSGMGVPSLDGLGPIGGNDHAPASTSRSTPSSRAPRCWPASSSLPAAIPRWPNGGPTA